MRREGRALDAAARDGGFAEVLRRYRVAVPGATASEAGSPVPLAVIVPVLGAFPPGIVAALALNAAAQLARIHASGAVHGELTPWNVLLTDRGPLLGRSGGAGAAGGSPYGALDRIPRTLAYLTPEQILGVPTSPATDVFALGAVLAFAATGQPPFGDGEPDAVLFRVVSEPARLHTVPASLRGLVKSCLSKDAERRPTLRTVGDRALGVLKDTRAAQGPSIRALEAAPAPRPGEPVGSAFGSLAMPAPRTARITRRRRCSAPRPSSWSPWPAPSSSTAPPTHRHRRGWARRVRPTPDTRRCPAACSPDPAAPPRRGAP